MFMSRRAPRLWQTDGDGHHCDSSSGVTTHAETYFVWRVPASSLINTANTRMLLTPTDLLIVSNCSWCGCADASAADADVVLLSADALSHLKLAHTLCAATKHTQQSERHRDRVHIVTVHCAATVSWRNGGSVREITGGGDKLGFSVKLTPVSVHLSIFLRRPWPFDLCRTSSNNRHRYRIAATPSMIKTFQNILY